MSGATSFTSFSGWQVWLNLAPSHHVLRVPARAELAELLAEFRRRRLAWLTEHLCAPIPDRGQLFGLSATKLKAPRAVTGERWLTPNTSKIRIEAVPPAAWAVLRDVPPLANSPAATRLFNATIEQQREFLLAAMGNGLESTAALLRPAYRDALVYPWLMEAFEQYPEPADFLAAVIERSAFERARQPDKTSRKTFLRCPMPDLFLLWLAQNGVVLFPLAPQPVIGEVRGTFEERLTSQDLQATWKAVEAAHAQSLQKSPAIVLPRLQTAFRSLTLASTLRTAEDLSLELFEAAYAAMDSQFKSSTVNMLHRIYRPLRDSLGRRELPTFKPRRSAGPELEHPFAWTQLATSEYPRSTFPRTLTGDYMPLPHVCAWADRFGELMAKLPIKSVSNSINTCQRFLVWLVESGAAVGSMRELTREHINDGKPLATSSCFRAHLSRDGILPESANAHLLRLAWTCEAIIEEDRLAVANPVLLRFDGFKVPVSRGKTPRRPMGRELLTYLRELNRRDNYALSRSYAPHQRQVFNAAGQYEPLWFPGFAVIVDLLLQLPLRGFQARFLDSGEGDELVVAEQPDGLRLQPNPLATATPGRRESLFYTFEAKDGRPTLGIHVNTNKTAVDRVSGYEIAWCSPELREALRMLQDWQVQHNPVARPVPCIEKHEYEQTQNQDVLASLKTSYVLFRDPADPQGWPINRNRLFDYWSRLLAFAEDELAAEGKQVRLTDAKEVAKVPNKRPVTKRVAAYDIHTLRVSGISALIEAGMPPDLVQDVAGHATLVMTLYYNKIKASRLNESLSQALDKMSYDLDSIDGMSEADFERLSEFLVNNRASEDSLGQTLLGARRGHGDGSVEVLVHGICPGGECATGGEYISQVVGYGPVPRAAACSLCRYRLTGPMFLPGLVLNANRLMHELRTKGKEIAALNEEREQLADAGKPTHAVKARTEALYRETDAVATEWAAEVQYVHTVERLFEQFAGGQAGAGEPLPALVSGLDGAALESRLTAQSELKLLQTLAEGAELWPGFRPTAALTDHREFLNEVLAASGIEPFLLKLRGEVRDKAAVMLGRVVTSLVPDERHNNLRAGVEQLEDYPNAAALLNDIRSQVGAFGALNRPNLFFGRKPLPVEQ